MAHFHCLYGETEPAGCLEYWRCRACFKCASCGSAALVSEATLPHIKQIFALTQNFSLCCPCALILALHSYCKVCRKFCRKETAKRAPRPNGPLCILDLRDPSKTIFACEECKQEFHAQCYAKTFPEIRFSEKCASCIRNSEEETQHLYERLLLRTR